MSKNPWITTASGKTIDLFDPTVESIDIFDIAHHLSHLCRFTGATRFFYSVAAHSLMVCEIVIGLGRMSDDFALAALLHDAAEAYLGDVSRPLKGMIGRNYKSAEIVFETAIAARFGLRYRPDVAEEVKRADLLALAIEKRDLMRAGELQRWDLPEIPRSLDHLRIRRESIDAVRNRFLLRFHELGGFDREPLGTDADGGS